MVPPSFIKKRGIGGELKKTFSIITVKPTMKKVVLSIIAAVVLFFIAFFLIGVYLTSSFVDEQVDKLVKIAEEQPNTKFSFEEVDSLPASVQKYFSYALTDRITKPRFARIKQSGRFKTNINAGFKDLTAEQYVVTSEPGFIWSGDIHLFDPIIWIRGIDTYVNGSGSLLIKFMSGVTITRETGEEIAQAQIVRWLMEAIWCPTALLPSGNLEWSAVDSTSAEVHFKENDIAIDAIFHFNDDGSINKITAKRYMTTVAGPALTNYTGYVSDYKEVKGMKIPFHVEVEWNLDHQDFKYGTFDIEEIEYDVFKRFED